MSSSKGRNRSRARQEYTGHGPIALQSSTYPWLEGKDPVQYSSSFMVK